MSAETPDLFLPNTGAKLQNTGATAETAIREALAAGPTPGVWVSDSACGLYAMNVTSAGGDLHVATVLTGRPARASDRAVGDIESTAHGRGNQLLITACNPASITELLAELDRLRATHAPGAPGQEAVDQADVLAAALQQVDEYARIINELRAMVDAAEAGQEAADDREEAAEIIGNLIAGIEKHGMYSKESTLMSLTQAYYSLRPENPAQEACVPLRHRIVELVEQHGSLRAAARFLECDVAYLWRLHSGENSDPSDALLSRMGLRQVTTFERINP